MLNYAAKRLLWVASAHSLYWKEAVRREFLPSDCSRPHSRPGAGFPWRARPAQRGLAVGTDPVHDVTPGARIPAAQQAEGPVADWTGRFHGISQDILLSIVGRLGGNWPCLKRLQEVRCPPRHASFGITDRNSQR